MLLNVDLKTRIATKTRGEHLKSFDLDERALQGILHSSLDTLIPEGELLLLMQSRQWQEEPDLMAIDKDGKLYIFELKIWESKSENILQVLRYGQKFGSHKYEDLDRLHRKFKKENESLKDAYSRFFEQELPEEKFNHAQVFVVVTNGIDLKTRQAIQYWREKKLDVRPWIYRVYRGVSNSEILLEISTFSSSDNPYEDISEGCYILNTNINNSQDDHDSMLREKKAAAFYSPPKFNIEKLNKGDIIFLYESGVGIIAVGTADGKLRKRNYHDDPKEVDEEYFMKLKKFHLLTRPISASEIKEITGIKHIFRPTMFGVDRESGLSLQKEALSR